MTLEPNGIHSNHCLGGGIPENKPGLQTMQQSFTEVELEFKVPHTTRLSL